MDKTTLPPCYGIIPARYGSTRFPGKPLANINGKPMFWHVFSRACRCEKLSGVSIATDDSRIAEAAKNLNVPFVMTRSDHHSGTDRVKEAADHLHIPENAVIINIQGDEPLLDPFMLSELIEPFENPEILVTTLARYMDESNAGNPDRVKVVFAEDGRALYFSRARIPYSMGGKKGNDPCYGHIGLYAFRKHTLDRFVSLAPGRLEQLEKLEQLRLLENNIPVHVAVTRGKSVSVDRPEDIAAVLAAMGEKPADT